MKSYSELLLELKRNGITPATKGSTFYEFEGFPLENIFKAFYEHGQAYLEREDLDFIIKPSGIYFNTHTGVNALARESNGYFLVEIFKGTIFYLYELFYSKSEHFEGEFLLDLNEFLKQSETSPGEFLFQLMSLYFFYHEVGHLIQRVQISGDNLEFHQEDCNTEETIIRHMRELDADWFAAQCLVAHLKGYSEDEVDGESILNRAKFEAIASLALAGLYLYFIERSNKVANLYFQEHCHPHPSIRFLYMHKFMLDSITGNVDFYVDESGILKRAIAISAILTDSDQPNLIKEFSMTLYEQLDDCEKYVKKVIKDTDGYDVLCVHKLVKK